MSNYQKRLTVNHRKLAGCIAIICVGIWFANCKAKPAEAEPPIVVSVRAAKAERQNIAAKVSALGTINPAQQATVSAKISAPIAQMAILKNKAVRAGEIIAVLEARDLLAQK